MLCTIQYINHCAFTLILPLKVNRLRCLSVLMLRNTGSTADALFDKVEALLPEHRERLYPPTETLSMFLAQAMNADRSCQNIVNQAAFQRRIGGLAMSSTHTGAYFTLVAGKRHRLPRERTVSSHFFPCELHERRIYRCVGKMIGVVRHHFLRNAEDDL